VFPASPQTFVATLFDYNGVLANDETVHLAAFQDALAPLGIALTEADYWAKYLGFDDVGAFGAILTDSGRRPDEAEIARLVEAKRPLYRARAEASLPLFPGASELIRRRAAAGPVGIVSGALRDEIELGIDAVGVRDLIVSVVAAEDTRASKPDPHGYLLGIEALSKLVSTRSRIAIASSIVLRPMASSATPGIGKVRETAPAVITTVS